MLIQLLEVLKKKKTCTLQELAELTGEDLDSVKMKRSATSKCQSQCSGCSNCVVNQDDIWIVKD